jgi:small-conductance mechanosensitive channel
MSTLSRRRSVVATSVVASLFVAAFTIHLAASWTAGTAPLADQPPDPALLVAQLEAEQARAADLAAQLDQVTAQSNELRAALQTAQQKVAGDASTAEQLAAQLEQARTKLKALQAQLAADPPPSVVTVVQPAATSASSAADNEYEENDEHDD